MLSLAAPANAATPTRMPFRLGASFADGSTGVPRLRVTETAAAPTAANAVIAGARPRSSTGSVLFGGTTHDAREVQSARMQLTSQKYAHTTRITAAGGGAVGPHPARDPV